MNINLKFTSLEPTEAIRTYANQKFLMLEKILKHLDEDGSADLHLELALTTHHHQKGSVYSAKANLHIPGKDFQVQEEREDLYAAIDIAKDTLLHSLEKYKDLKLDKR